ncbi:IQ domain-containing protein M, partial [Varanus komodoensis]
MLYPPCGLKLKTAAVAKSTWLKPIIDGEDGYRYLVSGHPALKAADIRRAGALVAASIRERKRKECEADNYLVDSILRFYLRKEKSFFLGMYSSEKTEERRSGGVTTSLQRFQCESSKASAKDRYGWRPSQGPHSIRSHLDLWLLSSSPLQLACSPASYSDQDHNSDVREDQQMSLPTVSQGITTIPLITISQVSLERAATTGTTSSYPAFNEEEADEAVNVPDQCLDATMDWIKVNELKLNPGLIPLCENYGERGTFNGIQLAF